jgi:hypothetical protein
MYVIPLTYKNNILRFVDLPESFEGIEKSDNYYMANTPGNDHLYIGNWVLRCVGSDSILALEGNVQDDFFPPGPFAISAPAQPKSPTRPLVNAEMNLIRLSKAISSQRVVLKDQADSFYLYLQVATITTIFLGLVTTVLVSLGATDLVKGKPKVENKVRFLSILFPAASTAAAAVIAFYGFQSKLTNSTHTSTNLAQLHSQMTLGITDLSCVDAANPKNETDLRDKVHEWAKRYQDIQTVADAAPNPSAQPGTATSENPSSTGQKK